MTTSWLQTELMHQRNHPQTWPSQPQSGHRMHPNPGQITPLKGHDKVRSKAQHVHIWKGKAPHTDPNARENGPEGSPVQGGNWPKLASI